MHPAENKRGHSHNTAVSPEASLSPGVNNSPSILIAWLKAMIPPASGTKYADASNQEQEGQCKAAVNRRVNEPSGRKQ